MSNKMAAITESGDSDPDSGIARRQKDLDFWNNCGKTIEFAEPSAQVSSTQGTNILNEGWNSDESDIEISNVVDEQSSNHQLVVDLTKSSSDEDDEQGNEAVSAPHRKKPVAISIHKESISTRKGVKVKRTARKSTGSANVIKEKKQPTPYDEVQISLSDVKESVDKLGEKMYILEDWFENTKDLTRDLTLLTHSI